jgi:hypothetical protein
MSCAGERLRGFGRRRSSREVKSHRWVMSSHTLAPYLGGRDDRRTSNPSLQRPPVCRCGGCHPIDEDERSMGMIVLGVMVLLAWLMAGGVVLTAFLSEPAP